MKDHLLALAAALSGPARIVETEGKNILLIDDKKEILPPLDMAIMAEKTASAWDSNCTETEFRFPYAKIEGPNPRKPVQRGSFRKPALNRAMRRMVKMAKAMRFNS